MINQLFPLKHCLIVILWLRSFLTSNEICQSITLIAQCMTNNNKVLLDQGCFDHAVYSTLRGIIMAMYL